MISASSPRNTIYYNIGWDGHKSLDGHFTSTDHSLGSMYGVDLKANEPSYQWSIVVSRNDRDIAI